MECINYNSSYIYNALYENHITNIINNEEIIAIKLNTLVPMNEDAYADTRILIEAKVSDQIKSKLEKFKEFIKSLIGKFMENISNIFLKNKTYLEKYKDIILNKKPKDISFSYNGNYEEAIKRLGKKLPVFNYDAHAKACQSDSDAELIKALGFTDFTYNEGESESLAAQFKSYFLATDKGRTEGKFSDGKLNFTNMYEFCKNSSKMENIVKDDQRTLENSTNAILNAINTKFATPNESFSYISEADDNNDNDDNNPASTNLKVVNTNPVSTMNSYNKNDGNVSDEDKEKNANAAQDANETTKTITDITNTFLRVCRIIIAAKLTAVQQITNDYMTIIRAHVRSYVGNDKNEKDNKPADKATNYNNT